MSIRVVCPSCDKVYNLDDAMRGKKLLCRECKKPIEVPSADPRERDEDDGPAREDRISPTAGARGAAGRVRRDDDDEPRQRSDRRSRDRDRDDDSPSDRRRDRSRRDSVRGSSILIVILLCVGAVAIFLIGIAVVGVIVFVGSSPTPDASPQAEIIIERPDPFAGAGAPAGQAPGPRQKPEEQPIKFNGDVHEFVQAAVKENRLADVDIRGFTLGRDKYRDVSEDGGILIGFEVGVGKRGRNDVLKSWRPIFLTKKGEQFGKWQGTAPVAPVTVKAKPGYVVSGMAVRTGLGVDGFTVTFARLGTDSLDMTDTYTSEAVGGKGGRPSTIGGKGALFAGITGHIDKKNVPSSIGLVAVLAKE